MVTAAKSKSLRASQFRNGPEWPESAHLPPCRYPGEGRFPQPTTATQAWRLELVFLPLIRYCSQVSAARALGGERSFDDLVGALEERLWHGETERRGGLDVDD